MHIRFSAHGSYMHLYHVVWIPKYRKKILTGDIKAFIDTKLREIDEWYPDVHIDQLSIQSDHLHLIITIPPKHAVSTIVGKMKQNSSADIRTQFPEVRKVYWRNEFWSPGFFSSTVGLNEEQIRKYVEFQEKHDRGLFQLHLFKKL